MTGQGLTQDELEALASVFSEIDSAKSLLRRADFPGAALPVSGYANGLEFWDKVSEQLGKGIMPDGRVKILQAACRVYPEKLRWPEEFQCPRCGGRKSWPVRAILLQCTGCGHQSSMTAAGTILQGTRKAEL